MDIRIPSNQIVKSKYTIGKEYMYKDTYREYQGYYYELNNKLFTGKEFDSNAPELILIPKNNNVPSGFNILLTKASTYAYGKISGTKLNNTKLPSIQPSLLISNIKYLAKENNSFPLKIIFISEDIYNENLQNNILYSFTKVYFSYQSGWVITDQNRKDIPEIDLFLIGQVSNEGLGN